MSFHQFWRQFKRNHTAEISLYLIVAFILAAILAPSLSPYDPFAMGDESLLPPQAGHPMGTDDLGRDTLSRVIYGARVPLSVGFLAAATSLLLGAIIGSVAGYFGGRTDDILMRATEYFLVIPRFFLALLIVAMLGAGIAKIIVVIGILEWPEVARVVRAQFLTFREREFVLAARALGQSHGRIIFKEILPNAIPPAIGATHGLSARSATEQGAADDDPAVGAELDDLNHRYEQRFGFRFVVFVNRRPKSAIVPILRSRLQRTREEELQTGLEELVAIARDRWEGG